MTYQVLARKLRPKYFAQLVGQAAVCKALSYALSTNRLHHAYLFTGTRGVGKTTLARLLAKALNCERGIQAEPCAQCAACIEIQEGCFPDVLEVDAASRTRIEDTKELLDNVLYAPLRGRYKIYLIDEVHMLSGHSFNALLKTLEEPPQHVKFIFATTEPSRIPVTILSRCLHFNLCPVLRNDLEKYLESVLLLENIPFESRAISLLAQAAKGSVRDALSLLEQAIGCGEGKLQTQALLEMLGLQAHALIVPLMQAICHQNIPAVFELTHQLFIKGADFERTLELVLDSLQAISMMQMVPNAKTHIQNLHEIEEAILDLHPLLTPEQTQRYYQIALNGKRDLGLMPDLRRAFDMILLRMLCFSHKPITPLASPPLLPPSPPVERLTAPDWQALVSKLPLTGVIKLLAQHCTIRKWAPPEVQLALEMSQQPFLNAEREKSLSDILTQHFKQPIRVNILLEEDIKIEVAPKPVQVSVQPDLNKSELVQTLIEVFDAKLTKLTPTDSS